MQKKRIVILGAGISGLSLAYYLSKKSNLYDITILEKKSQPGGWICSENKNGFFFERGPRTFRPSRCLDLLSLIDELGMRDQILASSPQGKGRHLWIDGKMRSVPIWTLAAIKSFLMEWRSPKGEVHDESVWDFACRRFSPEVALNFFDPMVIGIYAGDIRQISMPLCFPRYKEWEEKYGSITKGFFKTKQEKGPYLFTFEGGVESVVSKIIQKMQAHILYNQEVKAIDFSPEGAAITTQSAVFKADYVFSALPCQQVAKLLAPELADFELTGTTVVNVGYKNDVLKKKGFGYIVSSKEKHEVLGVVFNSNCYPQQSKQKGETRLTVKLRRVNLSDEEATTISLDALKDHLGITASPDVVSIIRAPDAFPQLKVGHAARIQKIEQALQERCPRLRLVGNYLYGVGVNDCVGRSRRVAEAFNTE